MRPMRTKTLAGTVAAPMCWNGEEDDEMVKWRSLEGGSTASTDTTTTTTITTFRTGHLEGNAVVSSDVCRIAFTWAICQLSPLKQQKARSLHHRQTSTSGRLIKSSRKSSMSKTNHVKDERRNSRWHDICLVMILSPAKRAETCDKMATWRKHTHIMDTFLLDFSLFLQSANVNIWQYWNLTVLTRQWQQWGEDIGAN